jgi:hypothetical protein
MSELRLAVPFKGERPYVQSANIWDATCAHLSREGWRPQARLTLTFRQLIDRAPILHFPAPGRPGPGVAVGDVVLADDDRRETGYLSRSEERIGARIPDYENTIKSSVVIGSGGARLTGKSERMSAVEIVVAVTKFMHQDIVSRDVKWLATRLDLPLGFALTDSSLLEVRLVRQTDALATVSEVIVDGATLGRIAFNPTALAKS